MDPVDPVDPMDREDDDAPLEQREADAPAEGAAGEFAAGGFERWRRDSPLGSVGTGIARGLQYVFAPPADQPVIVASVPGDPPDPDRLQVILDPDDPTKSIVLLPRARADDTGSPGSPRRRRRPRRPRLKPRPVPPRQTPRRVDIPACWT